MSSSTHLERVIGAFTKYVNYSIAEFTNLVNQIKQTIEIGASRDEPADVYNETEMIKIRAEMKDLYSELINSSSISKQIKYSISSFIHRWNNNQPDVIDFELLLAVVNAFNREILDVSKCNSMLDEALGIYKDNMAKLLYDINNL